MHFHKNKQVGSNYINEVGMLQSFKTLHKLIQHFSGIEYDTT